MNRLQNRILEGYMTKDEFKDRVFEIMNDTEKVSIEDIETNDNEDTMEITLKDGSKFGMYMVEVNRKNL